MTSGNYELTIGVPSKRGGTVSVREYGHKGLTFIEGRHGHYYTIKFRNNTAARVLAVVSVDGIDVVDGGPATNESRGYVVPGYQSIEIKGWRTSKKKVNSFVFDTKPRAYSAQTQKGDDTNCGVIAVKVFGEQYDFNELLATLNKHTVVHEHHHHHWPRPVPAPDPYPWWTPSPIIWCTQTTTSAGNGITGQTSFSCSNSGVDSLAGNIKATNFVNVNPHPVPMPPSESVQQNLQNQCLVSTPAQENPSFNLGTGWGGEIEDSVDEVKFKRGTEMAVLTVYYSDEQGLKDAGIEVDKKPAVSKPTLPKAFHGFCTPPVVTSS
jgi:hypothetical protein